MPRLSIEHRNFVVHKRYEGHGYGTIVGMLKDKCVTVSKTSVINLCKKFENSGLVTNKKKFRPGAFGTDAHKDFINQTMNNQPNMTGRVLADKIFEEFGTRRSISRVNTIRRECGWTLHGTRYCQLIRDVNKEKRLDWCRKMLETQERFDVSNVSSILIVYIQKLS